MFWTRTGLVFLVVGVLAGAASADSVLFDFESEPVDGGY